MSTPMQTPTQRHVIDLSKEETDEFINCFICDCSLGKKLERIAISYINRFIGNEMSIALFTRLQQIDRMMHRFNMRFIYINKKMHIMFSIEDYFRLIAVDSTYSYDEYKHSYIFSLESYEETAELNGYHIGYSYNCFFKTSGYINFIIYKDDVIYIINTYDPNKEFKVSIEHTWHNTFINNKWTRCDYEFETPGLTNKQLKEYFDAILIINELKDGD